MDFYHHEGAWTNRMILGDSLLVMSSLAEKEGLRGQVQMIYVDPPYGIKFGSNWQVSTRKRDIKDGRAEDATRQPEQIRAFRDTWELGINSYLSYLRDRLMVARDLMAESASLFVQIGDENAHHVRELLDEVFGADNFCAAIAVKKTGGQSSILLPRVYDLVLWYARDMERLKYRPLFMSKSSGEEGAGAYSRVLETDGGWRTATEQEMHDGRATDGRPLFAPTPLTSDRHGEAGNFPFEFAGRIFQPPSQSMWKTTKQGLDRLAAAGRIVQAENSLRYVRYLDDFPVSPLTAMWTDLGAGSFTEERLYVVQTRTKVIQRCVLMTTDPGDLVFDPTCGSGTAAYVAEEWGRRWITIDTSRVALALARTRLMTARYPYYVLADSPEGQLNEAKASGQAPASSPPLTHGDVKKGFVYERVPHVTLKSIAQNPDINEGMTREEINAVIAHHTETEVLYDRPHVDPRIVRVSGPFTVESLSPHRVLRPVGGEPALEPLPDVDAGRFVERVLENLRVAGVQNTVKNERLTFDLLAGCGKSPGRPRSWFPEGFAGIDNVARRSLTGWSGRSTRLAVLPHPAWASRAAILSTL